MKACLLSIALLLATAASAQPAPPVQWMAQASNSTANLRGVSAVNDKIAWASGTGNTVLRTGDGGASWQQVAPALDAAGTKLDFRDVDALDARTAYALSIGDGSASCIYKTTDAGKSWTLQYTNQDPKGFLDAMTFWDASHGLVMGDSIDGHFQILITTNGSTWAKVADTALPPALPNEGAFAASGSNIAMVGNSDAWIGTGSGAKARVLHTADAGKSWTVADTPMASSASSGIFSVAFRDKLHGVVVGGDYKAEKAAVDNVAITGDGGRSWTLVKDKGLSGFRSAVKYVPGLDQTLVAVGPQGADISTDDGKTWAPLALPAPMAGFHALSFAPGLPLAWASGGPGTLARVLVK